MKSLKEKHIEAIEQKDYYSNKIEQHFSKIKEHKDNNSVWHIEQTKTTILEQVNKLDSIPVSQRVQKPLFGLFVGAKDLFCVKGMQTTAGSKILEDFVSPYTATVIKQIESEGGLIAGKTSMDEFAMGSFTNTSYLGKTTIKDYEDYTTGGSSGGSAASLKSEIFDFTIGSDTGGSVRQPTSFWGLVGYKPSYGAFSRYGMISYASSLDQAGFMTKTIEDMDYLISSIKTLADNNDPISKGLDKSYVKNNIKNLSIGYFKEFFESEDICPKIKQQYEEKVLLLKEQGVRVVPIEIELLKKSAEIYYIIACAEASSNLARYQGVYFGKSLVDFLQETKSENDYWKDVARYRSQYLGKEVQKRILIGSYVLSSDKFDAIYKKATVLRKDLKDQIENILTQVDYLILPTFPSLTPTWKDIEKMTTAQVYLADYMTIGFSLAGLPVVTLPTTSVFDIKKTTGLQIVGKQFTDYQLIKDCLLIKDIIKD